MKRIGILGLLLGLTLILNLGSFAQEPGDVYMWEFNEGSGLIVTDNSKKFVANLGLAADPTLIPEAVTDTPSGKSGDYAVQITGSLVVDDRIDPILNIQDGPITIECWLKMDAFDSYRGILAYGASYKVGFDNDQLVFTFYGIEDVYSGITMTVDGQWHHVAWVWTPGTGVNFYMDGTLTAEVATTNTGRALQNNFLDIGSETGGDLPMLGKIDRVRVHKAILSESELDSVAATPKDVLVDTIVSYSFDEGKEPFKNGAAADRPAVNRTEFNASQMAPSFSQDTPTAKTTDYSLNFDGNDRVVFTDTQDIMQFYDESFTFESWLKFDPAKQVSTDRFILFAYGVGGANGYSFSVRPGGVLPASSSDSPSGKTEDRSIDPNSGLIADDSTDPVLDIIEGPITCEAWVKLNSLTDWTDILRYGDTYKMGYHSNGNLLWTFLAVEDVDSGVPAPTDNAWHHVAMAWDPGVGVQFFLDGAEVANIATSNTNRAVQFNTLNIGTTNTGTSPLDGLLDRVRIHNAVLTAAQLDSDKANPKAPLTSTIVAYNFNETEAPYASSATAVRPATPRSPGSFLTVTTYGIIDEHSYKAMIPNDQKWHHVAAVHDMGVEFRYYIDGKLEDQIAYTDGVRFAEVYDFLIGAEAGGGLPYVGLLDRVKITRDALTEGKLDYFQPVSISEWALF